MTAHPQIVLHEVEFPQGRFVFPDSDMRHDRPHHHGKTTYCDRDEHQAKRPHPHCPDREVIHRVVDDYLKKAASLNSLRKMFKRCNVIYMGFESTRRVLGTLLGEGNDTGCARLLYVKASRAG